LPGASSRAAGARLSLEFFRLAFTELLEQHMKWLVARLIGWPERVAGYLTWLVFGGRQREHGVLEGG
jgi:hypothetical protein